MNIFKSVGTILNAVTAVFVRTAKAAENLVEVVEITTEQMVLETRLENEQSIAVTKADLAKLRKKLAEDLESAKE